MNDVQDTAEKEKPLPQHGQEQELQSEQELQPEQEQVDPSAALRQAVAHNYLQHCINHVSTELDRTMPAEEATHVAVCQGLHNAIGSLILTAYSAYPEHAGAFLDVMSGALGGVEVSNEPLPQRLMINWAVAQSRQGHLNTLIGQLRDAAERDRNAALLSDLQQLHGRLEALTPKPKKPAKAKA